LPCPIALIQILSIGKWRGRNELGHDPQNKVLGIIGMGGIGGVRTQPCHPSKTEQPNRLQELAHRARAFGMKIIYHNRRPLSKFQAGDASYVSFDDLLSEADIISLNLSLNASTRHIIGAPEFAKMKDGVIIINTARGALMDEAALIAALDSGKVFSAGLDVFEDEPIVSPELLKSDKVVILPHIGTGTYETQVCFLTSVVICFSGCND